MKRNDLLQTAVEYTNTNADNYIKKSDAIDKNLVGVRMYEEPIMACQSADDSYFQKFKEEGAIGPHFMLPQEWLPGAKSVISFFFPFTEQIRVSNRREKNKPSNEWLHARIEGQVFIADFCLYIKELIEKEGHKAVVPAVDPRFAAVNPAVSDPGKQGYYTSNWSERHAAFVCGHGTFGLSKGIITKKGMAGRLGSLIVDFPLEYDQREYTDIYEYCTMCGACIKKCPVNAISMEAGKIHPVCSRFLDHTKKVYAPRYGCGKCQSGVPCETRIPGSI